MHCIIRGKFVISPCRKSALFWIHAVILLFHAEILPCGPPLLPHSCAEPFLGVVQKYSFLGDIYTSGLSTAVSSARDFLSFCQIATGGIQGCLCSTYKSGVAEFDLQKELLQNRLSLTIFPRRLFQCLEEF